MCGILFIFKMFMYAKHIKLKVFEKVFAFEENKSICISKNEKYLHLNIFESI